LLGKSTYEIHDKLEGEEGHGSARVEATFNAVLVQIVMLDTAFSLDSVITALGMVDELGVMIATVVIAVLVMMISAEAISGFVNRHPTLKTLALRFFSWSDSCLCWRASKKARASLRSRKRASREARGAQTLCAAAHPALWSVAAPLLLSVVPLVATRDSRLQGPEPQLVDQYPDGNDRRDGQQGAQDPEGRAQDRHAGYHRGRVQRGDPPHDEGVMR
jgi:hypothetical protein